MHPGSLRRSTAPFLLVGGTADKLWDPILARELTPYLLEVPDADHGMYVPGRLAASAAVLGQVATAVENSLDEVVWPEAAEDRRVKSSATPVQALAQEGGRIQPPGKNRVHYGFDG